MAEHPTGVVRICREYARGYDLKLTIDAIVIVIADDDTIRKSEVYQIFGRSSRAQGPGKAIIIIKNEQIIDPELAWADIFNRVETVVSSAVRNLVPLYLAVPKIKDADLIEKIRKAYENNKWKRA